MNGVGVGSMVRFFVALLVSSVLASCQSATTDSFTGPTGAQVQSTKCSQSPQACFKTASEVCKGPYQVIDSHSNAGGLVADIVPGPVTWYAMTYQCGKSDGTFPKFPFRGATYTPPTVTHCARNANTATCATF